ncbi:hypothetical protein EDC04DRAFT_2721961 [Pisolithus marmoratus]|nr:hypothetical protein EDC04DRAFT_2721961 [Pisolithus marmoratus]
MMPDSPSKNTRSRVQVRDGSPPPIIISPTKKRGRRAGNSDLDVWDQTNEEIIAAAMEQWKSKCYDHYSISLIRHTNSRDQPKYLEFKFTCKFDPQRHPLQTRHRENTSHGTKNLLQTMRECNTHRNVGKDESTTTDT